MTRTAVLNSDNALFSFGNHLLSDTKEFCFFCKDMMQGLLSGLLMLLGSSQLMASDFASVVATLPSGLDNAVFQELFSGSSVGGLQIAAAVLLFISTKRGIARTIGVLALIALVLMQNSGVSTEEFLTGASDGLRGLADRLESAGMSFG